MKIWKMKSKKIPSKSKNSFDSLKLSVLQILSKLSLIVFYLFRLIDEAHKIPMPAKMYTKPVDVNKPHHFGVPKKLGSGGVSYDPLPWSEFFDRKESIDGKIPLYIAGTKGHVFLCLHGAGHSALSFASLAKYMKDQSTVVSFDFRGHGDHYCENEGDLSEETLINETIHVFKHIGAMFANSSIIMVGHSMGGSIATKASAKIMNEHKGEEWHKKLQGLFVIDVVEGSAMDALPFMENIVTSRPQEFKSIQSVV
jgi:Alpha/beta hydrolase family